MNTFSCHQNIVNYAQGKSEKCTCNGNVDIPYNSTLVEQGNMTHFENPENVKPSLRMFTSSFNGSLEDSLINSIRPESKAVVDNLIEKIQQLSILQKMLLYLKLPSSRDNPDLIDPLRKPINPLGNRMEVSQALAYIKTHFLPDPDISLPKKEIYNEYAVYCLKRKIKPLSTADFGKAMKQVYPVVRPRRLGERGNSRYCYSGLRNRDQLNKPKTPGFPVCQARDVISKKICGWASKVLNIQVDNLTELSGIIPSTPSSSGSENCVESSTASLQSDVPKRLPKKKLKIKVENTGTSDSRSAKQRKTSKQKKCKTKKTNGRKGLKHSVNTLSAQSQYGKTLAAGNTADSDKSNVCDTINQKLINVDTVEIKSASFNCFDLKSEKSTNVEKRKRSIAYKHSATTKSGKSRKRRNTIRYENGASAEIEIRPLPTEDNFGLASIEEEPSLEVHNETKEMLCKDTGGYLYLSRKPATTCNNSQPCLDFIRKINVSIGSSEVQECQTDIYNDIGYLRTESLGHYLQDEGNSQEPEEELLKYFKDPLKSEQKNYSTDKDISQLRLLLERNLPENTTAKYDRKPSERDTGFSELDPPKTEEVDIKDCLITLQQNLQLPLQKSSFPSVLHGNNSKRRVSFENIPDSFLQSSNTHRKNFSFTPISPRPPTISKSSVNLSPFVFPRETVFRGKLSITSTCSNLQQNSAPSPVLQGSAQPVIHISPLKSLSRSTSLSSTPSPITIGRLSSNNVLKGRSTPQDAIQEQTDSVKFSPLISPSSSSGVFLSPASPMSSCNSPVFTFRKSMSPVKQADDTKSSSKSNSSLLQSLLQTGKCTEIKSSSGNEGKSFVIDETDQKQIEPLAVDVYQFSHQEGLSSFRSQSVPTLTSSVPVSPSSNTVPFSLSSLKNKEIPPLLEIKPNELDVWDSVLNGYRSNEDNLLVENTSDNDTVDSNSQTVGNEVSMESVISNLCDFLSDKSTGENMKLPQVSRSHPNTPLMYNESSNSSRDPVVSAFPLSSDSKSYPSTPTVCRSQSVNIDTTNNNSSAKRNILPLLDNFSIAGPSFSDDIELHLNNLADLSGCDDAFNELAREVSSTNDLQ